MRSAAGEAGLSPGESRARWPTRHRRRVQPRGTPRGLADDPTAAWVDTCLVGFRSVAQWARTQGPLPRISGAAADPAPATTGSPATLLLVVAGALVLLAVVRSGTCRDVRLAAVGRSSHSELWGGGGCVHLHQCPDLDKILVH